MRSRRARGREVEDLLATAVTALGGSPREGQVAMARAVATAAEQGEHLLVQAGTGTGKSLAYLVPAAAHAVATSSPVVVSTAIRQDNPELVAALDKVAHHELGTALG